MDWQRACCLRQESRDLSSSVSSTDCDFGHITYCLYQFLHLLGGGVVLKDSYVILSFHELLSQIQLPKLTFKRIVKFPEC